MESQERQLGCITIDKPAAARSIFDTSGGTEESSEENNMSEFTLAEYGTQTTFCSDGEYSESGSAENSDSDADTHMSAMLIHGETANETMDDENKVFGIKRRNTLACSSSVTGTVIKRKINKTKSEEQTDSPLTGNEHEFYHSEFGETGKTVVVKKKKKKNILSNLDSNDMESLTVTHKDSAREDLQKFSHIEVMNSSISQDRNFNSKTGSQGAQSPQITSLDKNLTYSLNNTNTSSMLSESIRSHESMTGIDSDDELSNLSIVRETDEPLVQIKTENIQETTSNENPNEGVVTLDVGAEPSKPKAKKKSSVKKVKTGKGPRLSSTPKSEGDTTQSIVNEPVERNDKPKKGKNKKLNQNQNGTDGQGEEPNAKVKKPRKERRRFTRGTQVQSPYIRPPSATEITTQTSTQKIVNKPANRSLMSVRNIEEEINANVETSISRNTTLVLGGATSPTNLQETFANVEPIPGPSYYNIVNCSNKTEEIIKVNNLSSKSLSPNCSAYNIDIEPNESGDANICIALPPKITLKATKINVKVKGKGKSTEEKHIPVKIENDPIDLTEDSPQIKKEKVDPEDDLKKPVDEKCSTSTNKSTEAGNTKENQQDKSQHSKKEKEKKRQPRRQRYTSSSSESSGSSCGHSSCSACHCDSDSSSCSCSSCCSTDSDE